jgi:hypothetical protein
MLVAVLAAVGVVDELQPDDAPLLLGRSNAPTPADGPRPTGSGVNANVLRGRAIDPRAEIRWRTSRTLESTGSAS